MTDHLDELLAFLDFPTEHWVHLRTTNPIESPFGTVKTRAPRGRAAPGHAKRGWRWPSS